MECHGTVSTDLSIAELDLVTHGVAEMESNISG